MSERHGEPGETCADVAARPLFLPAADGRLQPTELTRGPWNPDAQHGGLPAALVARAVERVDAGSAMRVARLTCELLRPVPMTTIEVRTEILRPGRRVQLIGASLWAGESEVCRATALRIRAAAEPIATSTPPEPPPPPPEEGVAGRLPALVDATFASEGVEMRFIDGEFLALGPSTVWIRLRGPLVEGEAPSPLQRVAAAADFGNGVSAELAWDSHVFINPDLTIYLERPASGEWIALRARTRIAADGTGAAHSILFDEHGRIGHATQALLVERR